MSVYHLAAFITTEQPCGVFSGLFKDANRRAATFLSSRSIFWVFNFEPEDDLEWKGCPRLHARRKSESVDGHQPHILNSSNATATGRDASDSLWPGKSPGGRLPHGLVDFEIIFSTPTVPAAADSPGDPIALPESALSGMAVRTGILWMLVTSAACGR